MTRNEALEKVGALGGSRKALIGGGLGCLLVVLLACGLIFSGVSWLGGKAVNAWQSSAYRVADAPSHIVTKDGAIAALGGEPEFDPHDTPGGALNNCAVGETVTEIWRGGRIEGWACNREYR